MVRKTSLHTIITPMMRRYLNLLYNKIKIKFMRSTFYKVKNFINTFQKKSLVASKPAFDIFIGIIRN